MLAIMLGAGMLSGFAPLALRPLAWGLVASIALVALSFAFLRREGRDARSVGLHIDPGSGARLAAGAAIGFLLYGVHLLLRTGFAGGRVEKGVGTSMAGIGLAIATYAALATMEELGFRGYALRRLEERLGRFVALGIGAVAFGLLHLAYGWPLGAAMIGAATGAVLFGLAALVTRGLAAPIGLHAAWNIGGWSVGEKDGASLWRLVVPAQGAAASTVSYLVVMALGIVGFWYFGRRRSSRPLAAEAAARLAAAEATFDRDVSP
jgi:hypothetical protein